MDTVQDRVQQATADAIERVTRRETGAAECEVCGEPISELRRNLGARLCLGHQAQAEQQARAR